MKRKSLAAKAPCTLASTSKEPSRESDCTDLRRSRVDLIALWIECEHAARSIGDHDAQIWEF
ncbi:hypothetical protein, partial [Caballeronia sp. BR00000012568055]|uniref:hypothetical protein n=1 Tax=Caballeronia sp. BR00000012568055 TaxID=2918761 RepID=UPI0023F8DA21